MLHLVGGGGGEKKKAITSKNYLQQKIFTQQLNILVVFKFLIIDFGFLEVSANDILPA